MYTLIHIYYRLYLFHMNTVSYTHLVGAGAKQNKANKVGSDTKNGSAAGLGAKMSPSAILVINDGTVQMVNVNDQNSVNKLIDMIPSIASKIKSFGGSDDEETEETEDSVEIIE